MTATRAGALSKGYSEKMKLKTRAKKKKKKKKSGERKQCWQPEERKDC